MSAYCVHCFERPSCRHGVCLPCLIEEPDLLLEYAPVEPAPYPTDHRPGSPAKIEQLALRYAQRQELFHADDAVLMAVVLQRRGGRWDGLEFVVNLAVPGRCRPRPRQTLALLEGGAAA